MSQIPTNRDLGDRIARLESINKVMKEDINKFKKSNQSVLDRMSGVKSQIKIVENKLGGMETGICEDMQKKNNSLLEAMKRRLKEQLQQNRERPQPPPAPQPV